MKFAIYLALRAMHVTPARAYRLAYMEAPNGYWESVMLLTARNAAI